MSGCIDWLATLAMIPPRRHGTRARQRSTRYKELSLEEEIQCEFTRAPGYLHVCADRFSDKELSWLKKEARVGARLGLARLIWIAFRHFEGPGCVFPIRQSFTRGNFRSLVMKLPGSGSHVFEKSAVTESDSEKRRAKVNGRWIGFDRVVMATNNPLVGLASVTSATLLQTKLSLYTSYVIGARVPSERFRKACSGTRGSLTIICG